jgi:hypothetical protein
MQVDGPYVHYLKKKIYVDYIFEANGEKRVVQQTFDSDNREKIELNVATDEPGKLFSVALKPQLTIEPATTTDTRKLFIVSDIESNFKSLRLLLQKAGVIDDQYQWTFGTGHLALTGDFFDRGDQQTEVLWLIYGLEEKAKAAGGYVHFILGNHEIMNLSGDLRYVNKKYMETAALLGKKYGTFYNDQTELGRWLRTKNVVEKIGDILFMHGGISSPVNRMSLNPNEINSMVRPFYQDSSYLYPDARIDTLYSDLGPFWYRGYYSGTTRATSAQIDSTLNFYQVLHIATGHTVIADTISILFDGKLINTDVPHATGKSEGLLIEDNRYFRITSNGDRFQVMRK